MIATVPKRTQQKCRTIGLAVPTSEVGYKSVSNKIVMPPFCVRVPGKYSNETKFLQQSSQPCSLNAISKVKADSPAHTSTHRGNSRN
eukprot:6480935-Amphidinium_carterae.1